MSQGRRLVVAALGALLVVVCACARTTATRDDWQRMSRDEKTLYVRSLIGHEQATAAKGGTSRSFAPPEEYVVRIDAAYAGGDRRDVDEVFASLVRRV